MRKARGGACETVVNRFNMGRGRGRGRALGPGAAAEDAESQRGAPAAVLIRRPDPPRVDPHQGGDPPHGGPPPPGWSPHFPRGLCLPCDYPFLYFDVGTVSCNISTLSVFLT